jgi:hypothetical protein
MYISLGESPGAFPALRFQLLGGESPDPTFQFAIGLDLDPDPDVVQYNVQKLTYFLPVGQLCRYVWRIFVLSEVVFVEVSSFIIINLDIRNG